VEAETSGLEQRRGRALRPLFLMRLVWIVDESAGKGVSGQVISRVCPKSCDWIGKDVTSGRGEEEDTRYNNSNEMEIFGIESDRLS
jgi:hypothetical protein